MGIRIFQATTAPDELRVRLNPGSPEPFAVIDLDEYGRNYLAVDTVADADGLIKAAIEAKRLLLEAGFETDPAAQCGEVSDGFRSCTRTAGHTGGHVSHGSNGQVISYWPQGGA